MTTGRAAVTSLKQRLDATIQRCSAATDDPELLSDLARYICVLVSGFIEQSVRELFLEYVRCRSSPEVHRYVDSQLKRSLLNAKTGRIVELANSFDPNLGSRLNAFLDNEYKDAVDGVVALRNTISHGGFVGLTMQRMKDYYDRVTRVIDEVASLCVPPG